MANEPLFVAAILFLPLAVLLALTFRNNTRLDKIIVVLNAVSIIGIVLYWEIWCRSIERPEFFETSLGNKTSVLAIAFGMLFWIFRKGNKLR